MGLKAFYHPIFGTSLEPLYLGFGARCQMIDPLGGHFLKRRNGICPPGAQGIGRFGLLWLLSATNWALAREP